MPRYEFVEGTSSKFWEIERDGNSFTVRYGKIGTAGQTSTKEFDSDAKTTKEYDKIVAEKVKKGYQLVDDGDDGDSDDSDSEGASAASNPALEQSIVDDPAFSDGGSQDRWLVYADWLQSQDDPRGALIAAQASGGGEDLIAEHAAAFLGPFAEDEDLAPYVTIDWHLGFWRSVKVTCDYDSAESMPESASTIAEVVGHVLRHPSARFLHGLRIGLVESFVDGEAEYQEAIDTIVKGGVRPSLRRLFVGDFEMGDDTEVSWTMIGSLGEVYGVLPRLESLVVQGGDINLGEIDAPELRSLILRTGGLPQEPVQAIAKAKLPKLEHLELWFGSRNYGAACSGDDVAALLKSKGLPAVKSLGLRNSEFANELPALLAASKLLPQLERLDLSLGIMGDEGAQVLVDNAAKFAHLKVLDLERNYITAPVQERLKAALPMVTLERQQNPGDYVYVAVGE